MFRGSCAFAFASERQHEFHSVSTSEHDIVQVILEFTNLAPHAMGKCSPL